LIKHAQKLSLEKRGAILIAFILLCHLLFVIVLGFRLNEIHDYILAETVSQNIIRTGHVACNKMVNQALDDFFFMRQGRLSATEQSEQMKSLAHSVNEFVKLIYNDPKHKTRLRRFQNSVKEVTESLLQFGKLQESTFNWRKRNNPLERAIYRQAPELIESLSSILTAEQVQFTADAAALESSIARLVAGVGVFAIVNIAVAAGMGFYFAVMISNPLAHIRSNGKRLSNRQPLLPPLQNTFELSKLDSLLHAASDSLNQALLRNTELIENAADTIVTLSKSGELLSINAHGLKLLGFSIDEIVGRPVHEIASAEQSLDAETYLRNTVASEKPEVFELRLRSKFGDYIDTRWSCYWSGQHKKIFAVIHDISEQKRIEQLKEDFANMISHDLRSPLMAMHNSLTLILMGAKGDIPEQTKLDLARGVANIDHLMQLVNDLLDFQKMKAGKMLLEKRTFNMKDAATQTEELLSAFAQVKGVRIISSNHDLDLIADSQKILQLLTNLTSNAIKFSPEGAAVNIDYQMVSGGIELSVKDRGRGVAEENKTRIFEIFEQGQIADEKQGTGLGLAICKLIAEAHEGKIWVESKLGEGSTFRVFIPEHQRFEQAGL